ncbi:MAG: pyridoxamine 5'-phosphate oxidase family protein [Dermatophilaceae bacterium]
MSKDPMTRAEFVEFVRVAKLGVVATVDAEGHPEAALVDLAVTDHGEVLFDTKAAARKVVNIGGNQRVALVVGWADKVSMQAEGDAEVLWGAEREKYGRIHQEQVPKFPRISRGLHAGQDGSDVVALLRRAPRVFQHRRDPSGLAHSSA